VGNNDAAMVKSYGLKGALWGALIGGVLSIGLLWLTGSYFSFLLVLVVAAYGYVLRPGLRKPGLKSRW
jgi:hypothetical protein